MIFEALRVLSEDSVDVVWSRMYSTTSQVCKVASGANETRRLARIVSISFHAASFVVLSGLPSDLRRAAFLSASSSLVGSIDFVAGNADLGGLVSNDARA